MKRIITTTLVFLILTIGTIQSSFGQRKSELFNEVPAPQRENLETRLYDFIEFHRNKQWEKVYELIGQQYKNATESKLPKDEFLNKKLYSRIEKFTPKSVQKMSDGWWMIYGCGTFARGGKMEAGVEAYFENGNWYFSDIWSVAPAIDVIPRSCKH